MSKYLVKILSICALVVLLAVTIVGSAICVTEAVGCTLTVVNASEIVEEEGVDAESNVAIFVDGKKQEKNSIHLSKYTEVEVVYTGVENGYKFEGWYEGNYDLSKDKKVSDKTSYKFEVKKNTKLSAVANLRRIPVTFEGEEADGSPVKTESGEYYYGQELPKLSNSEDKYFQGWKVATEEEMPSAQIFNYATFLQDSVVLVPAWGNQEYLDYTINIAFKAGSEDIDTIIYNSGSERYSYTRTRDCYTLVGAEFDGKVYPYDATKAEFTGLGNAVVRKGLLEVDATAIWECDYDSFVFNYFADANYVDPTLGEGNWSVMASKVGSETVEAMAFTNYRVYFNNSEEENYFDLEADATSLFIDRYQQNYQTVDGRALNRTNVIRLSVGDSSAYYDINDATELSFKDILAYLDEEGVLGNSQSITVTFLFEL